MQRYYAYYSRNDSYSRSFNAELAEEHGRLPLTRFCAKFGLVPDLAKRYWSGEWHHVGKYAACVDYYDPGAFFDFGDSGIVDRMAECSRPRPTAAQLAARAAAKAAWVREYWQFRPWRPGPVEVRRHSSTFRARAEALIARFAPGERWRPEHFKDVVLTESNFLAKLEALREERRRLEHERRRAEARARLRRKFCDGRRPRDRHARLVEFLRVLNREWNAKVPDRAIKRIAKEAPRSATLEDFQRLMFEAWADTRG
jgi:hypothetical protein